MTFTTPTDTTSERPREAPATPEPSAFAPSEAGPADAGDALNAPPQPSLPRPLQGLGLVARPLSFNLRLHAELGDVLQLAVIQRSEPLVVTNHPDHARSLFTARPEDAPSITGSSPLRPVVGPNSVLTLVGPRHLQQRRLLLPPFHGDAVARYLDLIERITAREIERWPIGETFPLADRMQALTLDVIMGGVFGIGDRPTPGSAEHRLRSTARRLLKLASSPLYLLAELGNLRRTEPRGLMKLVLDRVDRDIYALIDERRRDGGEGREDVMALLLRARDEDGRPMSDQELRDELLTLVLAGHETTANSLAWTFERLLRTPAAYDRLREEVRAAGAGAGAAAYVEATIHEAMRVRPVIPMVGRVVRRPWRLGEYVVPAGTPIAINVIGIHHRADVYPEPLRFAPERFLERKPGTYTWLPFGGGIRRCLGATLAMAEQRIVLRAIAERTDLLAPSQPPEPARQRNVTTIPRHGCRVIVQRRR